MTRFVLAALALALIAPAVHAQTRTLASIPDRVVPGDVLLKLDGVDAALLARADAGDVRALESMRAIEARIALVTGVTVRFTHDLPVGWAMFSIDARDEATTEARAQILKRAGKTAGILDVDSNWWMRPLRTPDDEFYGYMWDMDGMGARAAWDITTGSSSSRVGVVDTGTLRDHEDLSGKDAAGFDFISFTEVSGDGSGRDSDYTDVGDDQQSFHGSHVAGTILANGDNGIGIAGVSWGARLVTGRALGNGGGATEDIMSALAWMAGDGSTEAGTISSANKPGVVNMSLGATAVPCSGFEQDVIDFANDQGVIVVIAAGNDGGPVNSPGNCDRVISVAASDSEGGLASYSSFGNEIDVVGPGGEQISAAEEGVLSLYADDGTNPPYTFYQGTSMAAPHVAGVVSLMLEINPTLDVNDVEAIFASSGSSGCARCDGKPVLRMDLAIEEAGGSAPDPTNPGDLCPTGVCSQGQTCLDLGAGQECALDCDEEDGSGCGSGEQCRGLTGGGAICTPTGPGGEGADCTDDTFVCVDGAICLSDEATSQCYRRCDMDYECGPTQNCIDGGSFAYCDPVIPGGLSGEGEGEGEGPACNALRGNLDCDNDEGCVKVDGVHQCVEGAQGDALIGELCKGDDDCNTGLCEHGVCTTECDPDGDCRDGFECDDDEAPGGICVPQDCEDESSEFCGDGWSCQLSPNEWWVCAAGEDESFLACSHGGERSSTHGSRAPGIAALALAFGLVRRRRAC